MQVSYHLSELPVIQNPIITIGNFDGVHLGHIHVLESIAKQESQGYTSLVITFWPHPRKVLQAREDLRFLTSIDEKTELIKRTGISQMLILEFSNELAAMTAMEFTQEILKKKLNAKKIVLGYDHRFGKDRSGGLQFLQDHNEEFKFILEEIPKREIEDIAISSSRIRAYLAEGELEGARTLLGRNYTLTGIVTEGNKLGRTIGFPTANLSLLFPEKLIPKTGVYAVLARVKDNVYGGMMNIGFRPTVDGSKMTLEVNIFDFSDDIYNEKLTVELISYMRNEQKFDSLESLTGQLKKDREKASELLKKMYGS